MTRYRPSLDELRRSVDDAIFAFLQEQQAKVVHSRPLLDELMRLLAAGGKRLRPAFCYWGYRAAGGVHGEAPVRAAASLELLHAFAVVHDDIMDATDVRRGEPTAVVLHGPEVALLTGDLALVLADGMLLQSGFSAGDLVEALAVYTRMRHEVIAGQFLDMRGPVDSDDETHARLVATLKSGKYTVQEPLLIGATLGRATSEQQQALVRYGAPLGEAFQFRDDLLGTFGTRDAVGKPVDADIRGGKKTILYAKTMALLKGDERAYFASSYGGGRALTSTDVEHVRKLMDASGARAATEEIVEELRRAALVGLDELHADDETRAALHDLANVATARAV